MQDEAQQRLRWMYLADHKLAVPSGMRCWLGDYRADIYLEPDGRYIFYVADCGSNDPDWWYSKPEYRDNVFQAMAAAETAIKAVVDSMENMNADEQDWSDE